MNCNIICDSYSISVWFVAHNRFFNCSAATFANICEFNCWCIRGLDSNSKFWIVHFWGKASNCNFTVIHECLMVVNWMFICDSYSCAAKHIQSNVIVIHVTHNCHRWPSSSIPSNIHELQRNCSRYWFDAFPEKCTIQNFEFQSMHPMQQQFNFPMLANVAAVQLKNRLWVISQTEMP